MRSFYLHYLILTAIFLILISVHCSKLFENINIDSYFSSFNNFVLNRALSE